MSQKGIDQKFVHYGIRRYDLSMIEAICDAEGIDFDWLSEEIPQSLSRQKVNVIEIDDATTEEIIRAAIQKIKQKNVLAMLIQRIKVSNYMMYLDLDLDLSVDEERPIILIGGSNGGGKTTLFEAISDALDSTKKFNLKNRMQDKFFAF